MTDRRTFIARTAVAVGTAALAPAELAAHAHARLRLRDAVDAELRARADASPERLADDEPFWARVREGYALEPDVVNLDHGWTNPTPRAAVEHVARGVAALEALPAERIAKLWPEVIDTSVRAAVAAVLGVPGSEFAFVRNATEALDTVILGVPLRAGDEIVCSAHDYYAMLDALEQRRARDGVVLRMVRPPLPALSLDALVEAYRAVIGPRTRLVLLTHPSNLSGQLLPARRIADLAHAAGAEVVVDGAQSLGLLDDPIRALDCDYYGASLHKWLGAPVGTGVLWMRPAHAAKVWPLIPPPPGTAGMGRFEWIGTAPDYVAAAVAPALALHASLGPARKAARLRYLGDRCRTRLAAALPQARFYTAADPAMSCGLTTVEIPGADPKALQQRLRERDRILVQAMTDNARAPEIRGLRVSPNVYTTPEELDRFVAAMVATVKG